MKTKIVIKNRFTGRIIFEFENEDNNVYKTINEYIKQTKEKGNRANLSYADLSYADLSYADLSYANLSFANLSNTDLSYADLSYANLSFANLSNTDLSFANLSYADLSFANLSNTVLSNTNLSFANLSYADLSFADLSYADLLYFKSDFWRVILMAKSEIPYLKQSLIDGKINGSCYNGVCACLKGTLENSAIKKGNSIYNKGLVKNSSEPAEVWFLQIKEGQTPENSKAVKITLGWIEEFEKHIL